MKKTKTFTRSHRVTSFCVTALCIHDISIEQMYVFFSTGYKDTARYQKRVRQLTKSSWLYSTMGRWPFHWENTSFLFMTATYWIPGDPVQIVSGRWNAGFGSSQKNLELFKPHQKVVSITPKTKPRAKKKKKSNSHLNIKIIQHDQQIKISHQSMFCFFVKINT